MSEEKLVTNFNKLCKVLIEKIHQHKAIQVYELNNFSYFLRKSIREGIDLWTENYDELRILIFSYWHYEMINDDNMRCKCSYIQIFNMVCLLEEEQKDRDIRQKVQEDTDKGIYSYEIIKWLQDNPCGYYIELKNECKIDIEELNKQLDLLVENRYIIYRGWGDRRFYMLTKAGNLLYEKLRK